MKIVFRTAFSVALIAAVAACSGEHAANDQGASTEHGTDAHHAASGTNSTAAASTDSPATAAYKRSMEVMMNDAPPYTGDADIDFMKQMRVHHEAAITMSETVLKYGRDAETRKLAEQVMTEQQREIEQIDLWLSQRR